MRDRHTTVNPRQVQADSDRTHHRAGIGLIMAAVAIMAMTGMLALCFDLARIFIAKNELQTYADSATLAATAELDGTTEGIERARGVGRNWPNRWQFGGQDVPQPFVYFSQYPNGPWFEYPPDPEGMAFAQVQVAGPVRLYFAPIFAVMATDQGDSNQGGGQGAATMAAASTGGGYQVLSGSLDNDFRYATVTGHAAGGQVRLSTMPQGLLPYSPNAHLDGREPVIHPYTGEPDPFNWVIGRRYTFRWPPPGLDNSQQPRCAGDADMPEDFPPNRGSDQRGFIDIGEDGQSGSGGSSYIRLAILNGDQGRSLRVGEPVINVGGGRETEVSAIKERIGADADSLSKNFSAYLATGTGTGERLVYMPVNNPYSSDLIVEFAAFFLPPANEVCGNGNNRPCCAEYVGAGLVNSNHMAARLPPGVYQSQLTE